MTQKKTHNSYSLKYKNNNSVMKFGQFGIKIMTFGIITERRLNSCERSIQYFLKNTLNNKKNTKIWNLITYNLTLTKLSSESRMGKGKGSIYEKAIFLKPGTIIFEFTGISYQHINKLTHYVRKKFPFKINTVRKF